MPVRVDFLGQHKDMKNMDLSTSNVYQLQKNTGFFSFAVGTFRSLTLGTKSPKEELENTEGPAHVKAALKARIFSIPDIQTHPTA